MKFNQSARKILFLFLHEEFVSVKSIKGQFWDLAVLILWLFLKRNLEICFPGFCMFFFQSQPGKVHCWSKSINFTKKDKNGKQTEEVTRI